MIKKSSSEVSTLFTPQSSRWSAGEGIACMVAGELSVGAAIFAWSGVVTSNSQLLALAGSLVIAAGIAATVCLTIRKERLSING
ncbi:hypothetical protein [Streptomyces atroolivaceus]|uniref:hypothetical protein n=1 Tax=Streptomyces atroolivaceus TaxID=66869 RepID=UPI00341AEF85